MVGCIDGVDEEGWTKEIVLLTVRRSQRLLPSTKAIRRNSIILFVPKIVELV